MSSVFAADLLSVQRSLCKLLDSLPLPASFYKAMTLVSEASAFKPLLSGRLP